MPVPTIPGIIPMPFAHEGQKNVIQESNDSTSDPSATWSAGFPPITLINKQAGGKPPYGLDFNGLFNALSQHLFFQQSGGVYPWNAGLNYLAGAHVLGSDGNEYGALAPSGPEIPAASGGYVGAVDPVGDTTGYWRSLSAGLTAADTFRQSQIGVPRWWRSSTLPPHHVWADGSLALFADWPEFAQVYQSGGLSGMTLPADSAADTIAANPGKWVMNEAGTGLYTPRLGGWFMRNWTPGQTKDVGRAAGTSQAATQIGSRDTYQAVAGPNYFGGPPLTNIEEQAAAYTNIGFGVDADYSGPAYMEYSLNAVRPANLAQPVCIYLGNPA